MIDDDPAALFIAMSIRQADRIAEKMRRCER